MPELPGQEPLPPLIEEDSGIKSAGYRLVNAQDGAPAFFRFEFANGKEIVVPGPLSDEQQEALMRLTIYAYNGQDGVSRLLSDIAAAKQEARLATHHVGVLGDQLGKAEAELAAARAEIEANYEREKRHREELERWKRCVYVTRGIKAQYWGERNLLRRALAELVALKDLKEEAERAARESVTGADTNGLSRSIEILADYESRKPAAWSAARALVAPEGAETKEPTDADLIALLPPAEMRKEPKPSPGSAARLRERLVRAAEREKQTETSEVSYCPCRRCLEAAWQKKQDEAAARGETLSPLSFNPCNPNSRMILCSICGNKRCPHATFHENPCSGSNLPGQPGLDYPDVWKDRGEESKP